MASALVRLPAGLPHAGLASASASNNNATTEAAQPTTSEDERRVSAAEATPASGGDVIVAAGWKEATPVRVPPRESNGSSSKKPIASKSPNNSTGDAQPPPQGTAKSSGKGKGGGPRSEGGSGRKGTPWTEAEHVAFLDGLKVLGKGNWRGIAKKFVPTRTPTQVASHAQKHFLRVTGATKRKSRFTALEQAFNNSYSASIYGTAVQQQQQGDQAGAQAHQTAQADAQGASAGPNATDAAQDDHAMQVDVSAASAPAGSLAAMLSQLQRFHQQQQEEGAQNPAQNASGFVSPFGAAGLVGWPTFGSPFGTNSVLGQPQLQQAMMMQAYANAMACGSPTGLGGQSLSFTGSDTPRPRAVHQAGGLADLAASHGLPKSASAPNLLSASLQRGSHGEGGAGPSVFSGANGSLRTETSPVGSPHPASSFVVYRPVPSRPQAHSVGAGEGFLASSLQGNDPSSFLKAAVPEHLRSGGLGSTMTHVNSAPSLQALVPGAKDGKEPPAMSTFYKNKHTTT